jgi:hypothetical protein
VETKGTYGGNLYRRVLFIIVTSVVMCQHDFSGRKACKALHYNFENQIQSDMDHKGWESQGVLSKWFLQQFLQAHASSISIVSLTYNMCSVIIYWNSWTQVTPFSLEIPFQRFWTYQLLRFNTINLLFSFPSIRIFIPLTKKQTKKQPWQLFFPSKIKVSIECQDILNTLSASLLYSDMSRPLTKLTTRGQNKYWIVPLISSCASTI